MKRMLAVAAASVLITCFSGIAWCSVVGDWYVEAKMSTQVKISGYGTEKNKGYAVDYFTFEPGGYFEMIDAYGTWASSDKGFIVQLDRGHLEDFYEDMLSAMLGFPVTVTVEEAVFTGKEKKGDIIKGKFKLLMSFYNNAEEIEGIVKARCKFIGMRDGVVSQSGAFDADGPAQFGGALVDVIQDAINSVIIPE